MWTSVLERVVELAGGRMEGGVVIITRRVEPDGRRHGPQEPAGAAPARGAGAQAGEPRRSPDRGVLTLASLARRRSRRAAPARAFRAALRDGAWESARRLTVDYQLADPSVLRAIYARDAPLEGRDMLLQVRFLGLRFSVGVRVGEVYEEIRELGGALRRCRLGVPDARGALRAG